MDYEALRTVVYKLNEDEQFYKKILLCQTAGVFPAGILKYYQYR
ncbi:MAG: hypothetical protein ACLR55_02210 [Roseburia sp.]